MKIKEHNVETGEIIEREMNSDELNHFYLQQEEENARIKSRLDAEAKLEKIGISLDDLKALGL